MSTTHHTTTPAATDPVVLYDVMREAATRVGGRLSALQDQTQDAEESARLFEASLEVEDRVAAVDVDDLVAIQEMTDRLRVQYDSLR